MSQYNLRSKKMSSSDQQDSVEPDQENFDKTKLEGTHKDEGEDIHNKIVQQGMSERVKKTVLTPTDALINLCRRIFKILRDPPQYFMIYLCFMKILRNASCSKEVLTTQHLFFSTITCRI